MEGTEVGKILCVSDLILAYTQHQKGVASGAHVDSTPNVVALLPIEGFLVDPSQGEESCEGHLGSLLRNA